MKRFSVAAWVVVLGLASWGNVQAEEVAGEQVWPGIRLDREAGVIDLDAIVVMREGDWLELIACSPRTKEHESILAVAARPSHIHLALLALGLEPGKPMTYTEKDGQYIVHPAEGPEVAAFYVLEREGQTVEVPATAWVIDRETGEPLEENRWIFAGSSFVDYEGKRLYMADLNGTILSLVNFGEDLLTRPTELTNQTDGQRLGCHTEAIPPLDTPVILRLRPVEREGE